MKGPADALDEALKKFAELVRKDPAAAWDRLKGMGLIDDEGRYIFGKDELEEAMVPHGGVSAS